MNIVPRKRLLQALAGTVAIIIVLIPFHALLTVWLASLIGHYTALRLWKECLLLLLVVGATYVVTTDAALRRRLLRWRLMWVIAAYCLVQFVWGVVALEMHQVDTKALAYGWLVDTRYLLFFVSVYCIAIRITFLKSIWQKVVFWPAALVVALGLLQYFVLPYDFLRHLGYSALTIFPYEDINNNVHYIRIMSSLRGANPLGAYLVVVLCLVVAVGFAWIRTYKTIEIRRQKIALGLLVCGAAVVLVLTFSRAAWLGAIVGLVVLFGMQLPARVRLWVAASTLAIVVLLGGATLLLWHNTTFQNVIFHTQEHSLVKATSDEGHASALQAGLHDVVHEPLGRGPGTAGPASVYNTDHSARIAENYFIQLAQEVGWIGLALFLATTGLVAYELWARRPDPLALGLLAALAGICVVNLFSHAWADDTLAYFWWGLAGLAIGTPTHAVIQPIDSEEAKR